MKDEDVKADEKAEEENFQQDTTLPQIYSCVCLHRLSAHSCKEARTVLSLNHPHLWQMLRIWTAGYRTYSPTAGVICLTIYDSIYGPRRVRKHIQSAAVKKNCLCSMAIRGVRVGTLPVFNENRLTGGRIWDWEMMLLGRLFCRLSVVISAQVTWKPVIRWWGATLDTRHKKLPVMFPSLMEKEAVRFSGFARTLGSPGPVRETYWPISEHSVVFRVFLFWFYFF